MIHEKEREREKGGGSMKISAFDGVRVLRWQEKSFNVIIRGAQPREIRILIYSFSYINSNVSFELH